MQPGSWRRPSCRCKGLVRVSDGGQGEHTGGHRDQPERLEPRERPGSYQGPTIAHFVNDISLLLIIKFKSRSYEFYQNILLHRNIFAEHHASQGQAPGPRPQSIMRQPEVQVLVWTGLWVITDDQTDWSDLRLMKMFSVQLKSGRNERLV